MTHQEHFVRWRGTLLLVVQCQVGLYFLSNSVRILDHGLALRHCAGGVEVCARAGRG